VSSAKKFCLSLVVIENAENPFKVLHGRKTWYSSLAQKTGEINYNVEQRPEIALSCQNKWISSAI
jgi:hypothetical protein